MPTLRTGDIAFYYETHGEGPAIYFAHGARGNHLTWWQQVPYFRDRFTCVTFDHRGFGQSLDERPDDQHQRHDHDLLALMDHLGHERAYVVAMSMGGATCLNFTVEHPDRVRALVMTGCAGTLDTPDVEAAWTAGKARVAKLPAGAGSIDPAFRAANPELAFLYDGITNLNPSTTSRPQKPSGAPSNRGVPWVNASQVATLDVPVLFVLGRRDVVMPVEVAYAAQPLFKHAELVIEEDAGHSFHYEKPEVFNRILDRFFAEHSG